MKARKKLNALYAELGIIDRIPCSDEETKQFYQLIEENKPLPKDVYRWEVDGKYAFYRYTSPNLSQEEIKLLILGKQERDLDSIRGSLSFFVFLGVLGLIMAIVVFFRFII